VKRRVIAMRHGAAVPADGGLSDRARPLEERGRAQVLEVAGELDRLGWAPDLALVSPAERTRETWAILADHLSRPAISEERLALYGGGWDAVRACLGELDPTVRTVLVVAHNPGLEEVVQEATGFGIALGTGHAVLLAGDGRSWPGALRAGRWKLIARVLPTG
jgi:phosphohistidine phosphatase